MTRQTMVKKTIAAAVIFAFLFQTGGFLYPQGEDEIARQFNKARDSYVNGRYFNARNRLERLIGIVKEKRLERKEVLGKCYLLLGAVWEKEENITLAEENYRKAKNDFDVRIVDGAGLENLEIYTRIMAEPDPVPAGGTIEKEGRVKKKKKKKFPWVWVAVGVIAVGVAVYFLFIKPKKKKTYQLTVTVGEGVTGTPEVSNTYKEGDAAPYSYSLQAGYSNLQVTLDGAPVEPSGVVTMNADHRLSAAAQLEPLTFEVQTGGVGSVVDIQEESSAVFNVRLSRQPETDVIATVHRSAGDPDIRVASGSESLTFTPDNWSTFQPVTLLADKDGDTDSGEAVIIISAPEVPTPAYITAREIDGGALNFETNRDDLSVPEGGTEDFNLWLSDRPGSDVVATIQRVEGDSDINVRTPRTITFTPDNWNTPREVVLEAADDDDAENGDAVIRISADNVPDKEVRVREIDKNSLNFITDTNQISVAEDQFADFQVKLSSQPTSNVSVSISRSSGDPDIVVVFGADLVFTPTDWETYKIVRLKAVKDYDSSNGAASILIHAAGVPDKTITAEEIDNYSLDTVTDKNKLTVLEGSSETFQVKLSAQPDTDITVEVKRNGDKDILISPDSLVFTSSDWDTYQIVTVSADYDADSENGQASVTLEADGIASRSVTVTEHDRQGDDNPIVRIDQPQGGEVVDGDVVIEATAQDDYGIVKVEFFVDDQLKDVDTQSPHRHTWSTNDVSLGDHIIRAVAYDTIGQTDEHQVTVTVADALPTVTVTSPVTSPLVGTVAIPVHAEDYRGVQRIRFFIGDTELTAWEAGPSTSVDYDFQLDTMLYGNGTYTFRAIAVDTGSQESEPSEITIIIQN